MRYPFGDYVLDTDRRELSRGSQLIAIAPQVFDTLAHLIENRERVISKDDLLDAVWRGRIVSESTLATHINAVRKAVGDSGEEQRLIRTVARKGFRFVGVVTEARLTAGSGPSTTAEADECAIPNNSSSSGQALDCSPSIPEFERRPGAGVFR